MRAILTIGLALAGCSLPDSSYLVDGVPVVCEHSKGPGPDEMQHAVGIYRAAARDRFELDAETELATWRGLEQILWTSSYVAHGARYDSAGPIVHAQWKGCILAVLFFRPLLLHYVAEPTDEDMEWVDDLHDARGHEVCHDARRTFELPW